MKRSSIFAGILALSLGFTGCTSTQTKDVTQTLVQVLQGAETALDTLQNNPQAIADAEAALSAVAAVAPQTGPVHQAVVDAQAALNALQKNQGNLQSVKAALEVVVSLLENQGSIPLGAVRPKAK